VAVSARFDGQRVVARHRQVYAAVAAQLQGPVHALALHTYTPAEWRERRAPAPASPDCLGGSKADRH
jgi:BolA protein